MEEHVLWMDHWERGGRGIASSHLTSSWNPPSRVRKTPCLKIPIALDMFPQKRKEASRCEEPALQRCESGQWDWSFLPLGT
jgi:hypothetical protein